MAITFKDVEHVAALANLRLSIEEMEQMTGELNTILEYAGMLNELDTRGVEPTASVIPAATPTRKDTPWESLDIKRALENAPRVRKSYIVVPRPIED